MLAARLYGIDDIRVEEAAKPRIAADEVLVKVKVSAICGTDIRMLTSGAAGVDEAHPLIPGHEIAGDIDEVGDLVKGYKKGMRVAVAPNMGCGVCDRCIEGNGHLCADYRALGVNTDGGFAEYVRIPAQAVRGGNLAVLPEHVSYTAGALNEPLSCVYNGAEHCAIRPGDLVLVVGAGTIGLMHAAMARLHGAGRVVVSDLSEERLALCEALDPAITPIQGVDDAAVARLTGGHGFDVVIVACPSPAAQQVAFGQAAVNGRVCFFGGLPKDRENVALNSNIIHYKQLIVTGTTRASLAQYRKTLSFISSGIIKVDRFATASAPLEGIHTLIDYAKKAQGLKNTVKF